MKFGSALINDVESCKPARGTAAFWWLGQQSFIVRTNMFTMYLDPFLTDGPDRIIPPFIKPGQIKQADFIFGTHDHCDHIDRPSWPVIAKCAPATRFVVPLSLVDRLSIELAIPRERFIGIDEMVPYVDGNISIYGVPAAHEFIETDITTGHHPYMGYVIETSGLRLYHFGDGCIYEGLQSKLKKFGPIDIMMIPINGRSGNRYRKGIIGNMGWEEAVDFTGALGPELVIPAHYDMFENNRGNIAAFAEYLEAKYPDRHFWIGAHAERVIYAQSR